MNDKQYRIRNFFINKVSQYQHPLPHQDRTSYFYVTRRLLQCCCMANINYSLCIGQIKYGQFWGHTLFKTFSILLQFAFLWLCKSLFVIHAELVEILKDAVTALLMQLTQSLQRAWICKGCSSWFTVTISYSHLFTFFI